MFRAVKTYDGSDTSKCISLTPGDTLSAVHALDETWFIGFNEKSGEIGAFPINCVEAVGNEYGPLPTEDDEGHKMDEKAIYANVSKQIQSRLAGRSNDGLDPVERSRTLSAHAKTFDASKIRGTKPEKTFRLTLVKKENSENENTASGTSSDPNDPRRPSVVRPEEIFTLGGANSTSNPDIAAEEKQGETKVTFSNVTLEHSISSISADSNASWQDSFEISYETPQYATPGEVFGKTASTIDKNSDDGKYHKLKRGSLQKDKGDGDNKLSYILKIVLSVISALCVLGLMFVALALSFGYSFLEAGVITGVSTVPVGVLLGISPLCRCVMALVLPNLISGRGRTAYMIILTGLLISYPVLNISHSVTEAGRSLACLAELAENQSKAVNRQLAQPYSDIAGYIDTQRRDLAAVAGDISGALGEVDAHLNTFYGSLALVDDFLADVANKCKQPFVNAVNRCASQCSSKPEIEGQCLQACSFMYMVSNVCDGIKDVRNAQTINDAAAKARTAMTGANDFFTVDIQAVTEAVVAPGSTAGNASHEDISANFQQKSNDFDEFVNVVQKLLSFSIVLLFLQSFWYTRSYISNDNFDNTYITKEFKDLDKNCDAGENGTVLPLKEREKDTYPDTSACRLFAAEMTAWRIGLVQVGLHFLLTVVVVVFDVALFHVLDTVRVFGEKGENVDNGTTYRINVTGSTHVANFYRILLQGINLKETFTTSLDVSTCLPMPNTPSVGAIASLFVLYFIAFALVFFRGYGTRMRRKIAAIYFPDNETARLEFLHKHIILQRSIFANSLPQKITSLHREYMVLQKLSVSGRIIQCLAYLERVTPVLNRCVPKLRKLRCTGCRQPETSHGAALRKCTGEHDGVLCEATYCEECRDALNHCCPICSCTLTTR